VNISANFVPAVKKPVRGALKPNAGRQTAQTNASRNRK
jgi:hypothetical protein